LLIDVAGVWRGHAKKSWPWLLEMCPRWTRSCGSRSARGREPEAWLVRGGDGACVKGGVGAVDVCAFGAVEPPGDPDAR